MKSLIGDLGSSLLRVYHSVIRSKLDYGSVMYSGTVSYLSRLNHVYNQALRLCYGAFRTSPMNSATPVLIYVDSRHTPSTPLLALGIMWYYASSSVRV
ncbi:hypothetical protein HNY73_010546 [Argiope bruennichi]|uniref:Uncharacterized protein n=1 Tax=Argiope bruennichi TaxID=94029 RepID=A0A8T0F6A4_ARGBR|nr:hypothetical protein HNY73_010546 [Argiope bruennichi]